MPPKPELPSFASERRLRALLDVMQAFAGATTDYPLLIETVARRMTELIASSCMILLISEDKQFLEPVAVFDIDPDKARDLRRVFAAHPLPLSAPGFSASVVRTRRPVFIPQVDREALLASMMPEYRQAAERINPRSILATPMLVHGEPIGVVHLTRNGSSAVPFDETDAELAREICMHAALAINNARLMLSVRRELHERRRAEREAEKFVALVQNSADFIAIADLNGSILFINEAGRRLLGLGSGAELSALSVDEFFDPEWREQAASTAGSAAVAPWIGEKKLRRRHSEVFVDVAVTSFAVRSSDGTTLCLATVQRDLTETKLLSAQLQQAQKMDALGKLAGGVAHDFNNLLTVINGYGSLLALQLQDEAQGEAALEIVKAGERAAGLTHQLLAYSRKQPRETHVWNSNLIIEDLHGMLSRLIGESFQCVMDLAPDLHLVRVDRQQVEQALMNLVINARDAMPAGGTIVISTRNVDDTARDKPTLGDSFPGPSVELAVRDFGAGIPAEIRPRIFEPFFTTKPAGKGTGLGLAVVYGIVRQSAGSIVVESEPGQGTVFRIRLPAATPDTVEQPHPVILEHEISAIYSVERVLLVEDNAAVRKFSREALIAGGFDVLEAASATEAIAILNSDRAAGITLVITDMVMPKLGGRAVVEHMQLERPGIPVLLVSGYVDDAQEIDVPFLAKPFSAPQLLGKAREVLGAHRKQAVPPSCG